MWQFTAMVTAAGLAALLVMAWIECYIRDRNSAPPFGRTYSVIARAGAN